MKHHKWKDLYGSIPAERRERIEDRVHEEPVRIPTGVTRLPDDRLQIPFRVEVPGVMLGDGLKTNRP